MFFSITTFDSKKERHLSCQHRVSLNETRQMNYKLTLKGHVKNVTKGQGHDLIKKIMLYISRFVS